MTKIDKVLELTPKHSRIQVELVCRYGVRTVKYQVKYLEGMFGNTAKHTYTGNTLDEALTKLEKKLKNPEICLNCGHKCNG